MDWKKEAKDELRNYERLKMSLQNIKDRIQSIEEQKFSLKSSSDDTPVQGGGSKHEDKILNLIVEEERLKHTYKANKLRVSLVEKGLDALNDIERTVITEFAKNRPGVAVELIADKTGYERAQIYRIYDSALYKFTIAEYGISEF